MNNLLCRFSEIWLVDFEFRTPPGGLPFVVCMVAVEHRTGRRVVAWRDELLEMKHPPFNIGFRSLVIAYLVTAELACFLALGWSIPANVADLYVEFRNLTSGKPLPSGAGLIGALIYHGLPTIGAVEKEEMRDLVLRGGQYTAGERQLILDYCASDVEALARLLDTVGDRLTRFSLLRGRYMKAVAQMERTGTPIDEAIWRRLVENWECIKLSVIERVSGETGIYEGTTFRKESFERWLATRGIRWPRLSSGSLELKDETFQDMAKLHPELHPIRELRHTLSQMKLHNLAVGEDGRNRCMLSPFASVTGRNQPSTSRFIFGLSAWLRSLIRPEPETALAILDWSQQEFGIAAKLSQDQNMMDAYTTSDPYLAFAKLAGAVPWNATVGSHGREREIFKTVALAVQYSMQADSLTPFRKGLIELLSTDIYQSQCPSGGRFGCESGDDVAFVRRQSVGGGFGGYFGP